MFNKTHITNVTHQSPSKIDVKVTENRAPTDDSIRLAEEYKQKVLSEIVDGALYNGNSLELVTLLRKAEVGFDSYSLHWGFKLNGKLYEGVFNVSGKEYVVMASGDPRAFVERIIQIMADDISRALLKEFAAEVFQRWSK